MSLVKWLNREFEVHLQDANWNAVGGIYVFAGLNADRKWHPVYIGQAKSLRDRLLNHERWEEAKKLGTTHVHALGVKAQADRDVIEAEMIKAWKPKLNIQLK